MRNENFRFIIFYDLVVLGYDSLDIKKLFMNIEDFYIEKIKQLYEK